MPLDSRKLAFAYIYCHSTGQVLIEHRICDLTYGVPGGAVDEGEDIPEALLREIREETGYQARIEDITPLCDYDCSIYGRKRHAHIFVIEVDEEFEPKIQGEDLPPIPRGISLKTNFSRLYNQHYGERSYKESFALQWSKPESWPEPMNPHMPRSLKAFSEYISKKEKAQSPMLDRICDTHPAMRVPAPLVAPL